MKAKAILTCTVLALAAAFSYAQTQGVSKDEILIGSFTDLSGPLSAYGKHIRAGMQMRLDEVNEQGGVNGRKLRMLLEDHVYDPKRAALAAEKLVNQDKIFAMVGAQGTPHNIAIQPLLLEKKITSFMPISASHAMYEPSELKWAWIPPNEDLIGTGLSWLVKETKVKKVCILYQDDEYGLSTLRGTEIALKAMGMELVEKTSYKRGATEFSSQVARLKAGNCELVVMGAIIRETIATVTEGRKIGFNPILLGQTGLYSEQLPKLGGPAMNGIYSVMTQQFPYLDDSSPLVRSWANKYKTRFNEDPSVYSLYGYLVIDMFATVARKAGPNLTTASFNKVMEGMSFPQDIFGGPALSYSTTKHLGGTLARVSQLVDGKWKVVSGAK